MKILLLLLMTLSLASYKASGFLVQASQIDKDHRLKDKTGDLTPQQIAQFQKLVIEAEKLWTEKQKIEIATYIVNSMDKIYNIKWCVFITNNSTTKAAYDGYPAYDNYLWRINYGKHNFTYFLWLDSNGHIMHGGESGTAQYGTTVPFGDHEKIKAIVSEAIVVRGDNMESQAQFIRVRLRMLMRGVWNIIITQNNAPIQFGFYICRNLDTWAFFRSFGQLKWNYYMAQVMSLL